MGIHNKADATWTWGWLCEEDQPVGAAATLGRSVNSGSMVSRTKSRRSRIPGSHWELATTAPGSMSTISPPSPPPSPAPFLHEIGLTGTRAV